MFCSTPLLMRHCGSSIGCSDSVPSNLPGWLEITDNKGQRGSSRSGGIGPQLPRLSLQKRFKPKETTMILRIRFGGLIASLIAGLSLMIAGCGQTENQKEQDKPSPSVEAKKDETKK